MLCMGHAVRDLSCASWPCEQSEMSFLKKVLAVLPKNFVIAPFKLVKI